jgi:hypothetical protein
MGDAEAGPPLRGANTFFVCEHSGVLAAAAPMTFLGQRKIPKIGMAHAFKLKTNLLLFQLQRRRINAISQTGRFRAIRKYVAQVCTALIANDFSALHAVGRIFVVF